MNRQRLKRLERALGPPPGRQMPRIIVQTQGDPAFDLDARLEADHEFRAWYEKRTAENRGMPPILFVKDGRIQGYDPPETSAARNDR